MSDNIFTISKLTKKFGFGDNTTYALKDVNTTISKGEFVGVTGVSGSGKTTFLNMLAGLIEGGDGSIHYDGGNLIRWSDSKKCIYRNQEIGYVLQNFGLIADQTVEKNILVAVKKNRFRKKNKAHELLILLGIDDKKKSYPHELSGGQKQRVAIARALMNEPKIILADEPTGALDTENSEHIFRILEEINRKGTTVILVTHDESLARRCERVLKFKDGSIIEDLKKELK